MDDFWWGGGSSEVSMIQRGFGGLTTILLPTPGMNFSSGHDLHPDGGEAAKGIFPPATIYTSEELLPSKITTPKLCSSLQTAKDASEEKSFVMDLQASGLCSTLSHHGLAILPGLVVLGGIDLGIFLLGLGFESLAFLYICPSLDALLLFESRLKILGSNSIFSPLLSGFHWLMDPTTL